MLTPKKQGMAEQTHITSLQRCDELNMTGHDERLCCLPGVPQGYACFDACLAA